MRRLFAPAAAIVLAAAVTSAAAGAATGNDAGSLTGDWSGTSVCTPNHDACHNEQALYHLKGPNDRNIVTVTGSRIVDGREIVMGPPLDFRYDPEKKTLSFEGPFGTFGFTVTGTTIARNADARVRRAVPPNLTEEAREAHVGGTFGSTRPHRYCRGN